MAKVLGSITCQFTLRAVPWPSLYSGDHSRFPCQLVSGKVWPWESLIEDWRREEATYFFLILPLVFFLKCFFLFLVPPHWADLPSGLDPIGQPSLWVLVTHSFLFLSYRVELLMLILRLLQSPLFAFQLFLVNQFPLFAYLE